MQYVKRTEYGFYCTYPDCPWEVFDDTGETASQALEHDLAHQADESDGKRVEVGSPSDFSPVRGELQLARLTDARPVALD